MKNKIKNLGSKVAGKKNEIIAAAIGAVVTGVAFVAVKAIKGKDDVETPQDNNESVSEETESVE